MFNHNEDKCAWSATTVHAGNPRPTAMSCVWRKPAFDPAVSFSIFNGQMTMDSNLLSLSGDDTHFSICSRDVRPYLRDSECVD